MGRKVDIEFVPYMGVRFPDGHPKAGREVPRQEQYYAVPGGGVATAATIRKWAAEAKAWIGFRMREE